ncbi:MAG: hypothetical protein E6K76_11875 [Candidatus Eisenbacteria bacterium]|uniref:Uncharacterized protein n=1 Tax=Eiseniibacteriota bacterium TaxID=2212470 RepID=A0A538T002_UNCEI|nr:MAG: hypothetical protein E6K76_11875 [Candidatus Eisenbacteria bacterium]
MFRIACFVRLIFRCSLAVFVLTQTATGAPTGQPVASISTAWAKPQPNSTNYSAEGIDCGPAGENGDSATDLRKNRTDIPGEYHAVTFDAIAKLPYPKAPHSRTDWSGAQLKKIEPYEGVALTVAGYLVGLRVEGAEMTNCGMTDSVDVDWHMWISARPQAPKSDAIVVETTPRVRKDHPKWTPTALKPWINSTQPVRISGWLMMDPQHPDLVGQSRVTIWEIHPILKIEAFRSGAWVDLDAMPSPRFRARRPQMASSPTFHTKAR